MTPKDVSLIFKTVIPFFDTVYNIERLEEILKKVDDAKNPSGQKWRVHFQEKITIAKIDDIYSMSDEEIGKKIEEFFNKIEPTIKKVEKNFIDHKEELLKLKQEAENTHIS